ncbi:hypothetical protein [Streptomyces sp. NPDC048650]|uniref:hypothetical protein n=1 Tax=unclassified Streptomyces TaxID=2593676 RepID=UPI003716B3A2
MPEQNPFAASKGKPATSGPLDPSAGNPLANIPGFKQGPVVGLVSMIDQAPVGSKITVTQDVKDAAVSLGEIFNTSDGGGN